MLYDITLRQRLINVCAEAVLFAISQKFYTLCKTQDTGLSFELHRLSKIQIYTSRVECKEEAIFCLALTARTSPEGYLSNLLDGQA